MSGPTRGEQLYDSYAGQVDWTKAKVADLRQLADQVEEGLLVGDDSDLDNEQIANLLRAKADKIEAALRTIEQETHDDYNHVPRRPIPPEHELDVDGSRDSHPGTGASQGEATDDAECHNCGEPWNGGEGWDERHLTGGPSLGEDWYYTCPGCEEEVFQVGI